MKIILVGGLMIAGLLIAAGLLLFVTLGLIPVGIGIVLMLASMAVGNYSADVIESWEAGQ